MDEYISAIKSHARSCKRYNKSHCMTKAENLWNTWRNAQNKEDVVDYYDNFHFCILYAERLYECRARCFYELLEHASGNKQIKNIMKWSNRVYSFGCGPGPEIAAYFCYFQEKLQQYDKPLNVVAVDRVAYWGAYINQISCIDDNLTVEFKNEELNNYNLTAIQPADVCIMSYPHAIGFDDVWELLKKKFRLVLIVDQGKRALHQEVRSHGYTVVDFDCKGQKFYFYYVSHVPVLCERKEHVMLYVGQRCCNEVRHRLKCDHIVTEECWQMALLPPKQCSELVSVTCRRGTHRLQVACFAARSALLPQCTSKVKVSKPCGHGHVEKLCCEDSQAMLSRDVCGTVMHVYCRRRTHLLAVSCSNSRKESKCTSRLSVRSPCGHKNIEIACHENENVKIAQYFCEEKVNIKCQRGEHTITMKCSDRHREQKCTALIEARLPCGHRSIQLACYQDVKQKLRLESCDELVWRTCAAQLHRVRTKCSAPIDQLVCKSMLTLNHAACSHQFEIECCRRHTVPLCQEIVLVILPCGHSKNVPCRQSKMEHHCQEIVQKKCRGGQHDRTEECGEKRPYYCVELVPKKCNEGPHQRMEECSEEKTHVCIELVQTLLPCKHEKEVQCSQRHHNHYCAAMVQKKCNEEQHQRIEECSEKKRYLCAELVQTLLPCKHEKEVQCSQRHHNHYCAAMVQKKCEEGEHERGEECSYINSHICMELVTVSMRCSHQKVVECSQRDQEHYCASSVQRICASEMHQNTQDCSSTEQCKVSVQLRLLCGHVAEAGCGQLHFSVVPIPHKVNQDGCEEPLPVTLLVHPLNPLYPTEVNEGVLLCSESSVLPLSCLHMPTAATFCSQTFCGRVLSAKCTALCGRIRSCGHRCAEQCHLHFHDGGTAECSGDCKKRCFLNMVGKIFSLGHKSWNRNKTRWKVLDKRLLDDVTFEPIQAYLQPIISELSQSRIKIRLLNSSDRLYHIVSEIMNLCYRATSAKTSYNLQFLADLCVDLLSKLNINAKNIKNIETAKVLEVLQRLNVVNVVLQSSECDEYSRALKLYNILKQ